MEAALYVVATPLGNLSDITLRALEVLRSVDAVAAEDTRLTRQLLSHYEIRAHPIALHQHNEEHAAAGIVRLLSEGKSVAYVTDAGTPAISDPGALLVSRVRAAGLRVVPVPGPSAVTAALSAAGLSAAQFLFYGFLPSKAGRAATRWPGWRRCRTPWCSTKPRIACSTVSRTWLSVWEQTGWLQSRARSPRCSRASTAARSAMRRRG